MKPFAKFIFTGKANSTFDTPLILASSNTYTTEGKSKVLGFFYDLFLLRRDLILNLVLRLAVLFYLGFSWRRGIY